LLEQALGQLRVSSEPAELAASRNLDHARNLAADAAARFDVVIAAGGDGTVRAVASGLLQAGQAAAWLGLLPLGTGNDFATQLGLPDLATAVDALRRGDERRVDVIQVRGLGDGPQAEHYALLFAAAGFAPALLLATSPRLKRWLGRSLCYAAGFFRALPGFEAPRLTVRADGREFRGRFFHVCAGNSAQAGGGVMRLSPGARVDDGRLEVCLIEALGKLEIVRRFPQLLRGTFPGHPKVRYFPGCELTVESATPLPLALDGDVVGVTPAQLRVLPGALCVVAPAAG
jgi:diacylglycerol kinase (ATP)